MRKVPYIQSGCGCPLVSVKAYSLPAQRLGLRLGRQRGPAGIVAYDHNDNITDDNIDATLICATEIPSAPRLDIRQPTPETNFRS